MTSLLLIELNITRLILVFIFAELLIYLVLIIKQWYHVIILLLLLEFFRVAGFALSVIRWSSFLSSLFLFFFATLIVCEASMGIGLVIALTRGAGGEGLSF